MGLGAIGFMSIRKKSVHTLVNPNFSLLIPGHYLFYIQEALLILVSVNFVLFPLLEMDNIDVFNI